MIRIAIDGPSGAGKSSVARRIAEDLAIIYVDTGAMYRAIGLYVYRKGYDTKNSKKVISCLNEISITTSYDINSGQRIFLCGEDVSEAIRLPEIAMAASDVSAMNEVRDFLLNLQRNMADNQSVIMDGRDIGTVVLPGADLKIFLTASPEKRAMRRLDEYISNGQEYNFEDVLADVKKRDSQDSNRDIAPLCIAEDAILLDTTNLDFNQTIAAVKSLINNILI